MASCHNANVKRWCKLWCNSHVGWWWFVHICTTFSTQWAQCSQIVGGLGVGGYSPRGHLHCLGRQVSSMNSEIWECKQNQFRMPVFKWNVYFQYFRSPQKFKLSSDYSVMIVPSCGRELENPPKYLSSHPWSTFTEKTAWKSLANFHHQFMDVWIFRSYVSWSTFRIQKFHVRGEKHISYIYTMHLGKL